MSSSFFWNLMAGRYVRQPVADLPTYQRKLAETRACLRPDMRMLEFGCGSGATARAHAPHVAHIDAIDYSRRMIEIARGLAEPGEAEKISFHQATIEDWQAPDASYDAVLGLNVLHLLPDRHPVIARVRRLLRTGGVFVTSTACLAEMGGFVRWVLPVGSALGVLPHVAKFSEDQLAEDIKSAGFAIETHWSPGPGRAVFIIARAV